MEWLPICRSTRPKLTSASLAQSTQAPKPDEPVMRRTHLWSGRFPIHSITKAEPSMFVLYNHPLKDAADTTVTQGTDTMTPYSPFHILTMFSYISIYPFYVHGWVGTWMEVRVQMWSQFSLSTTRVLGNRTQVVRFGKSAEPSRQACFKERFGDSEQTSTDLVTLKPREQETTVEMKCKVLNENKRILFCPCRGDPPMLPLTSSRYAAPQ